MVGSLEFPGKPVGIVAASARAQHAPAQLVEVLSTMNAEMVADASVTVPLLGSGVTAVAIAARPDWAPDWAAMLRAARGALGRAGGSPAVR